MSIPRTKKERLQEAVADARMWARKSAEIEAEKDQYRESLVELVSVLDHLDLVWPKRNGKNSLNRAYLRARNLLYGEEN